MEIQIKEATLDGKKIGYSSETMFMVQLGKGKGKYRTQWHVLGNFGQAFLLYQGLNVSGGYKKRLLMPSCSKKPVIARYAS